MKKEMFKKDVRKTYTKLVEQEKSQCDDCCSITPDNESDMGLSCGNPVAIASLQSTDNVLDIGSGAGFDCFLAAEVATKGKVIGVDFSESMIEKAKSIALKRKALNVEFRLGAMEKLPVETASIDVVISNCAINLSPHKRKIYREIYRVLKPGGRIAVSDICLKQPLPEELTHLLETQPCLQANLLISEYQELLEKSNFNNIHFSFTEIGNCISETTNDPFGKEIANKFKGRYNVADYLVSIHINAEKS